MARWYAKFDAGTVSALDNVNSTEGFFERLRVSGGSSSAAPLRDGLIASRSAVSNDVYDDLDAANKDGSKGIYFPPDIATLPSSTLISWSTAYTSSVNGIKTPTTNTYGVSDSVNYSQRPTGSVTSSQVTLVGPTNPLDPVQLNYNVYLSASQAVRAVINTFQNISTSTVTTPYTRLGQDESRTLHSIWHNPTLDYFAWDDFTPGQPSATMDIYALNKGTSPPEVYPGGDPVNTDLIISFTVSSYEYLNDGNIDGKIGINMTIYTSQSGDPGYGTLAALQLNGGTHGGPLVIGDYLTGNGPTNPRQGGNSTWTWNNVGDSYTGILNWTIGLTAGEYTLDCNGRVYDVIITSHVGATRFVNTFPTTATNRFIVKAGNPA